MHLRLACLIVLSASCLIVPSAWAESLATSPAPAENTPVPAPPEKTVPAVAAPDSPPDSASKPALNEGIGLLETLQSGALGPSVWQGMDRTDLYAQIDKIAPHFSSPATWQIALRALLTEAEMTGVHGAKTDIDFLAKRLQKLNEIGAFYDVSELYQKAADTQISVSVAQAGLIGLVANNRTSVACLERKVHPEIPTQTEADTQLEQLCKALLGHPTDTPSTMIASAFKDETFRLKPAHWTNLDALSVMERGALIAQGRIDYTALEAEKLQGPFTATQTQIYTDPSLPPAFKTALATHLARGGFVNTATLAKLYTDLGKPLVLSAQPFTAPWENLTGHYVRLLPPAPKPGENPIESLPLKADDIFLINIHEYENSFGLQALLPFAPALAKLDSPENLPESAFRTGLRVLITARSDRLGDWLAKIPAKIQKNPENSKSYISFLLSAYVLGAPLPPEKLPETLSTEGHKAFPQDYALIALSTLFNTAELPFSTVGNLKYEKENLLTGLKNYVMHDSVKDDTGAKILESRHLGKVSLAAILAMQHKPIGEMDPRTLKALLEGLSSVGLEDVARQILTESLLQKEFIETGSNRTKMETETTETKTKENPHHGTSRPPSTTEAGSTSEH